MTSFPFSMKFKNDATEEEQEMEELAHSLLTQTNMNASVKQNSTFCTKYAPTTSDLYYAKAIYENYRHVLA